MFLSHFSRPQWVNVISGLTHSQLPPLSSLLWEMNWQPARSQAILKSMLISPTPVSVNDLISEISQFWIVISLVANMNLHPDCWYFTGLIVGGTRPRFTSYYSPVNMLLCASTGPVLGRCCQHRTSIGPVLATNGMFAGIAPEYTWVSLVVITVKSFWILVNLDPFESFWLLELLASCRFLKIPLPICKGGMCLWCSSYPKPF